VLKLVRLAKLASDEQHAPAGRRRGARVPPGEDPAAMLAPAKVDPDTAPLHLLTADVASRLAVEGATVVELGCGQARALELLARCRPDLRAVGIDVAARGLVAARARIADAGLADRVDLRASDPLDPDLPAGRVDVVVCALALHALPDRAAVRRVLGHVQRLRAQHGSAVWLLDLVRLRRPETIAGVADLDLALPADRRAAALAHEAAAWTPEEVDELLPPRLAKDLTRCTERSVGYLQARWAPRADGADPGHAEHWSGVRVGRRAAVATARLREGLPGLPTGAG
jgi:SAM-dependent methyltransferase